MAAKKKVKKSVTSNDNAKPAEKVNKTQWILAQDPSAKASDIVEKAASEGITISPAMVYTTRSQAKKSGKAPAPKKKLGRPKKGSSAGVSKQTQFLQLAQEIGLDEAEALLGVLRNM